MKFIGESTRHPTDFADLAHFTSVQIGTEGSVEEPACFSSSISNANIECPSSWIISGYDATNLNEMRQD